MILELLSLIILSLLIFLRWKQREFYKLYNELPKLSKKCWPVVGHAYLGRGNGEDRMKNLEMLGRETTALGGVTTFWLAYKLYIFVADAETADLVHRTCLEKGDMVRFLRHFVGNGTLFAQAPIWRPRRKIMASIFTPKALSHFVDVFAEQSDILVEQLRPAVGTGPFSMWNYMTTYTFDSICETTLGIKLNAQRNPNHPFLEAFEEGCKLVTERMCKPWLHNDAIYKLLARSAKFDKIRKLMFDFIDQVIKEKRVQIKDEKMATKSDTDIDTIMKQSRTFLEMLIESSGGQSGYTDEELREETMVIALAGTDTSAVASSFIITLLSKHPDVQEKVYEELYEVFGDSTRPIVSEDLPKLKYLDAVVRETLRLYPPVPISVREVEEHIKLPSGVTLVPGVAVLIHFWAIHRNPRHWGPDADLFRPERFMNGSLKHQNAFFAFGWTPRNCLGYQYAMQSAKTVCASILRHYRILPASPSSASKKSNEFNGKTFDIQDDPLKVKWSIMMKDVAGFTVQLEHRQKDSNI